MKEISLDKKRLKNRRQFLWGKEKLTGKHWNVYECGLGSFLSCHTDLEVQVRKNGNKFLAIIGICLDPFNPKDSNSDIADDLFEKCNCLDDLLIKCFPLSGRWTIIFIQNEDAFLLSDPCGFRTVFYSPHGVCGSDPNVIKRVLQLEKNEDPEIAIYMSDPKYKEKESQWVGSRTIYKSCFHLLPNHYLDLSLFEAKRFFPTQKIDPLPVQAIVDMSVKILEGSIEALLNRSEIVVPLTSGWDSRVLLAASRKLKDQVSFYIDTLGLLEKNHPDIVVPKKMAATLGLNFSIVDSREKVPEWFFEIMAQNVSRARNLPKTRMIYSKFGESFINVNGNVSEIIRNALHNYFQKDTVFNPQNLNKLFSAEDSSFSKRELQEWLSSIDDFCGYHILDLLYWEQRHGRWAAHFPAEQDISIEEISPFNCRQLLVTMLSSPRNMRVNSDPQLYKCLINAMWPEILAFPVNPIPPVPVIS